LARPDELEIRKRAPKIWEENGRPNSAWITPKPASRIGPMQVKCPKCEHVHKVLVEDPMNSGNAGRQNSDLKPPKVSSSSQWNDGAI
jgi:hypothetical protein